MAKKPIVHCRICKKEIDRNIQQENIDWIQPSTNWYYHIQCYNDFAKKKKEAVTDIHADLDNDLWFSLLVNYLQKELKMSVNFAKLKSQWENFLKKGMTAKGIFFAIRYFYNVQHGDPSKTDGIGIVTYIYNEGCQYWIEQESLNNGICAKIEAQIKHANEREIIKVTQKKQKKAQTIPDLAAIAQMEDEI